MKLTDHEASLFQELTKDMDAAKASRFRARLLDKNVVVTFSDPKQQALVNAIYASLRARAKQGRTGVPVGPPPRTAQNSWTPRGDDVLLINAILNRYPERYRAQLRQELLRKDIWLTAKKDDPESQKLLDQLYERRQKRIEEAETRR